MIILRNAEKADIEKLISVNSPKTEKQEEQWRNIHLKRLREAEVNSDVEYFVALIDNEIVGHVMVRYSGKKNARTNPSIEGLMVREDLRGRGIGTQIITEVEKIVRSKGFDSVGIACNPTENPKAKKLYEKLGYKQVGNKPYLDGVYDGEEDWVVDLLKSFK